MLTIDNIKEFWNYVNDVFDLEEITYAIKECEFDSSRLNENNLKKLTSNEIFTLYSDMVYPE